MRAILVIDLLSAMFLLGFSGWLVLEPFVLQASLGSDSKNFLTSLNTQIGNKTETQGITFLYQRFLLGGSLLQELALAGFLFLVIWFPMALIAMRLIYGVLRESSAFEVLWKRYGGRSMTAWGLLPYGFHIIDVLTAYAVSVIVYSGYETNPAISSLLLGYPQFYLERLAFASVLMIPMTLLIFTSEQRGWVNSMGRKVLLVILASPFIIGIITNLSTLINGIR